MIFAFAFSFLVALFWLKRFRKMDKYDKEPERLINFAFFAGALAIAPSALLESFVNLVSDPQSPHFDHLFIAFLWVGAVEEFFKYLAVRLTAYRSNQFNEVMEIGRAHV